MFYSQEEKERMRRNFPQFEFPEWKPNPNSRFELTKWINQFKKMNHLNFKFSSKK